MAVIARRVLMNTAEKKVKSINASGANTGVAGTVINLTNGIVEGDDIFDRSGTKIFVSKIEARFRATAVINSQTTRFIIFRDLFNQGTTPAVSDVLPVATVTSHYSDTRYVQQKRIVILDDWVVDVNIAGEAVKTRKFGRQNAGAVYYNGATAVAGSNGKGSIFLLVIGTAATGTYDYDITMVFNDS